MKGIAYKYNRTFPGRPTLIFLHDSLGCIQLWRDFPEKLGNELQMNVFVYDRLGYGKSMPFQKQERSLLYMEEEADFLAEIVSELNIENPILFGHSDGASIALIAAGKYPNLYKMILLEGAHIFVEDVTLKGINDATELYLTTDLKTKLEKYHGENTDPLFWAWSKTWNRPDFLHWNIESFLPNIKCPVFIMQGEHDEYGTMKQVEGIQNQVAGPCELWYIPGAGHNPHKEVTDETLKQSKEFVEKYYL